ncbi:MAG: hypothetical protein AMJ94_00145 [Deltaproteobacteria bacterium SM23_61]|nr:MAG: hypothetical protein AMJ94_00145 [Deltaproteobacteria bacterium SM23_61]
MGKKIKLEKADLVKRLEPIELSPEEEARDSVIEEMSLARSLLKLAEIDHEREYGLCRRAAERLLERVPEPDDLDIESE